MGLEMYFGGNQHWRFEAHYVPADDDSGPRVPGIWEYWRLFINPLSLQIKDWREDLTRVRIGLDGEDDFFVCRSVLESIVGEGYTTEKGYAVEPGALRIIRRNGLLFTVELDGDILPDENPFAPAAAKTGSAPVAGGDEPGPGPAVPHAAESDSGILGEFRMLDEIPLASVCVHVPVNSTDPVASARRMAARALHLSDFVAHATVRPFNPQSIWPRRIGRGTHTVTLHTNWRDQGIG